MPRQTRPSRDTARSHTPDAPRAMDSAAASSDVPAVLPGPWMFFNGRLVSADQYARSDPASEVPHSAIPPPPKLPAPATMPATRQSICRMPQRAAASRSATARAVEQCRGPTGRRGRSEAAQDRGGCRQGGAGLPSQAMITELAKLTARCTAPAAGRSCHPHNHDGSWQVPAGRSAAGPDLAVAASGRAAVGTSRTCLRTGAADGWRSGRNRR